MRRSALIPDHCFKSSCTFRVFGISIALRATDDALLQRLIAGLPPLAQRSHARHANRTYKLRGAGSCPCGDVHEAPALFGLGGSRYHTLDGLDQLVERYRGDVKMFVAEFSPRRVFTHAGVVALNDRAVLLPGESFSGKTTLVRALLEAGATYYSDEYAVLDHRGRVHPYPQPLGIRTDDNPRQIPTDSAALGYPTGSTPIPIALVIVSEYRRRRRWTAKPLSRARSVFEVLQHTVPYERDSARALDFLTTALAQATAFHGQRGDASAMARWIVDWLEKH